jgi:replicative DNA helicase
LKLYSAPSEKMLVCALLERPELRRKYLQHIHEDLFGTKTCREVYTRMISIQEQGRKVPTVGVMAHDPGLTPAAQTLLKIDSRDRVKLQNFRPTDMDHCLDQVRYYYKVRVLYEMNKYVAETFEGNAIANMDEVQAEIQQRLLTMEVYDEVEQNLQIIGEGANITDEYMDEHLNPETLRVLPTGYQVIDDRAKWTRGNMVLLTAKRGQGKSLLAKSLGLSHFRMGQNVMTVNLEMEKWEYLCRLFAETTPFTHDELRGGLAPKDIKIAKGYKKRLDFEGMGRTIPDPADPTGEKTIKQPCRWALRTVTRPNYTPLQLHNELRHQGYHVVIIDYINLFKQVHKDLWQSLYAHTKYLKMMAKELGILLYVLAQLTDDGRAKYARAAEEDSDAWLYWEINRGSPQCNFFHGKARHYKPFSFPLIFNYHNMAFVEPHTIGSICKNQKCRAQFPKGDELDQWIRDRRNPTDWGMKQDQKRFEGRGFKLLEAGKCPMCQTFEWDRKNKEYLLDANGRKIRKTYALEDHMNLLVTTAEKDADEHQKHVDETEAARRGATDGDRRRQHQERVHQQNEDDQQQNE